MKFNIKQIKNAINTYYESKKAEKTSWWPWAKTEPVPDIITSIDNYCRNLESINKNRPLTAAQNYQLTKYFLELYNLTYTDNTSPLKMLATELGDPESLYIPHILTLHDIYTFENYQKWLAYPHKSELPNILLKLSSNLSDTLFQIVVGQSNVRGLKEAIRLLHGSNVPEEYHKLAYQHANPSSMASALLMLQNHNILNNEWIFNIESNTAPQDLLLALLCLPENLLTRKNINLISLCNYPDQVVESIRTLYYANLWNDITYKYISKQLENNGYYNHQIFIFGQLQSANLLTLPYLKKALEHPTPDSFAEALKILSSNNQLKYLPNVFSHPMPIIAAHLINYLAQHRGINKNTLQCVQETRNHGAMVLADLTDRIPYEESTFKIMLAAKNPSVLVTPFVSLYKANIRDAVSKEIVAESPDPLETAKTLIALNAQQLLSPEVLLAMKKELPKVNHHNLFLFGAKPKPSTDGNAAPQKQRRASIG